MPRWSRPSCAPSRCSSPAIASSLIGCVLAAGVFCIRTDLLDKLALPLLVVAAAVAHWRGLVHGATPLLQDTLAQLRADARALEGFR